MYDIAAEVSKRHAYHEDDGQYGEDAYAYDGKYERSGVKFIIRDSQESTLEFARTAAAFDLMRGENHILDIRNMDDNSEYQDEYGHESEYQHGERIIARASEPQILFNGTEGKEPYNVFDSARCKIVDEKSKGG